MADTCKYFVYDYPNKQCDLYSNTADTDFSSYCDEEGGPALPVLANCAPSKPQTCSVSFASFGAISAQKALQGSEKEEDGRKGREKSHPVEGSLICPPG